MSDLMPSNSTRLEHAMADALEATLLPPVPIGTLWNPDTCPAGMLPWLAWSLSVDRWDRNWPEQTQRAAIRVSIDVHRIKGSRASIERALAALGFPDAEIVEGAGAERYDGTYTYDGALTYGTPAHWAEYRVYLSRPISLAQADLIRAVLETVAPARCHLAELVFEEAAALYDDTITYDGTYSYGVA